MNARSRPTTNLPASLIFAPRELKQYRRFQAQTTTIPPKHQGFLPTAAEYADFQAWLAKRDSGYLSDTPLAEIAQYVERASGKTEEKGKATTCGHALHPTHKEKADRCPVCTVEMHVNYMKTLTVALEDAGGFVKQRWEAVDRDNPALQAWYAGKLAFVQDVCRLESLAQDEQDYHHTQDTTDVKTAGQALEMYWDSLDANPNMMRSPSKKAACSVDFRPGTDFERGRDQHYFWRKSPRYEAGGKYASSSDADDDDEEDDEQYEDQHHQAKRAVHTLANSVATLEQEPIEEEQSDEEDSDLEDEDEEEDEEEDDDEGGDEQIDAEYIVFEYEEVVVQGAEFIVFED